MRRIAIMKECLEWEKNSILSVAQGDDKFFFFRNEQELLDSPEVARIDVIFGEPSLDTIGSIPNLRWIQMTWAGANKYTSAPAFPSGIAVTSASGAFGGVISEHILAGILTLYKNLRLYRSQLQQGSWQLLDGDDTLEGKRALILGTGNIGSETAKKLKAFGAYNVGICRTYREKPAYFDECYTVDCLDEELPKADLVIIALPGTKATKGMFCAERIQKMKPGAVLVNVGRGFIVDTQALTGALVEGALKGAVLDVTDPEPLPPQHSLRRMENVVLTPHVSGISWGENAFTRKRIIDIFRENLMRDSQREPLKNSIDFQKGY